MCGSSQKYSLFVIVGTLGLGDECSLALSTPRCDIDNFL